MAVSDGHDDFDQFDDHDAASFDDADDHTPACAERVVARCVPCLGRGRLHLVDGHREAARRCPVCRGAGVRIMQLRNGREVFAGDEMTVADTGRCRGSFRIGRRAPFGRVACPECGQRLRPMPGLRVPNHVAERPPRGPLG